MDNVIVAAFVTGITTGGLSCMAVQGGLITTSLANRLEAGLQTQVKAAGKKSAAAPRKQGVELAQPILLFLAAKLVVYTLLGFLLGALGSVLSLSAVTRGILQAAIGIFMLGNALRMLNVHPIFRYFTFEPPAVVTRYLRRKSKNQDSALTPLMLGAMTVLIPCGVTQAMMALAVGSGSAAMGAVILFAFTLGASPVFFGLTYLATRLGKLLEKNFTRVVAIVLLILGIWTIDTGLNLMGSPVSLSRIPQMVTDLISPESKLQTYTVPGEDSGLVKQDAAPQGSNVINIAVSDYGYDPVRVRAPANTTIKLNLTTNDTYSCARAFVIPSLDLSALLPAKGTETLEIPPQKAGTRLQFACSMGMYTGVIIFQ
jgi:sulfite exporter TauE/SafE